MEGGPQNQALDLEACIRSGFKWKNGKGISTRFFWNWMHASVWSWDSRWLAWAEVESLVDLLFPESVSFPSTIQLKSSPLQFIWGISIRCSHRKSYIWERSISTSNIWPSLPISIPSPPSSQTLELSNWPFFLSKSFHSITARAYPNHWTQAQEGHSLRSS